MTPTQYRYTGCLLGLAIGDAFGVPAEFKPRGTFPKVTEMIGGGPFLLKPGEWTDDTSMALCLANSLIDKNGFDAKDQMEKYWKWVEHGYMSSNGRMFDIGDTTTDALTKYKKFGNPFAGDKDAKRAGNGSLMRLASIPMYYKGYDDYISFAALSSLVTHGTPTCVCACAYYSGLIRGALEGERKDKLLSPLYCPKEDHWQKVPMEPEIYDIAMGCYKNKTEDQIKSSGYVVHTLEAALWSFYTTETFEEGLIKAVNLGDDADTVGAVYGMLAGAYYSIMCIPRCWWNALAKADIIINMAEELYYKMVERYESKIQPERV